jgi:hypothetical protein
MTLKDPDIRRLVIGLELLEVHCRSIGGEMMREECDQIARLQNRLDPTGRWCEALTGEEET